ncbi:MAG: DNA repair ATPase [Verrucomicrobiae bacterium]|nr:DNA repair ATPase [Verrucomicrobiae bacterium]
MPDAPEQKPAPPPEGAATPAPATAAPSTAQTLGSATYEIIRQRLNTQGAALREATAKLNARRAEVFGTIEYKLLQADRIVTSHNCTPRDMIQLGAGRFLFGFNVQFGLKKEMELGDVFAVYQRDEATGTFKEDSLDVLNDKQFLLDFKRLYNVYEKTAFRKFAVLDGKLYMKFGTGAGLNDFAVFKWAFNDGNLKFVDGRAEAEYRRIAYPAAHQFRWQTPDRESYRYGDHPHVSIEDRVFVECVGGDLTIKVEDNTATGEGVYAEPVADKYQKVDDAEIAYGLVGHLILLKIRPYKEQTARYFIFNEKQQTAVRVDSIGSSCVLLPEEHGLIFPDGYYLATGELKQFDCDASNMVIERVIHAPNGEDVLYVFYNRTTGDFALMPYRLIAQKVEERISCNGFSLFPNGHLVLFRAEAEPQKHHMIQLRQTPFHQPGFEPAGQKDAFLYQVGNKEVVRGLAECNEVLTLVRKENPYAELYTDLVKRCGAILDSYPWLASADGFGVDAALRAVREAADKAVDEFDKVRRLQREAVERVTDVRKRCVEQFQNIKRASFRGLNDFVVNLATLRRLRGELITLKEVRYVDVAQVEELEKQVTTQTDELSNSCVKFLLKAEALEPYRRQAADHLAAVDRVTKVAEGKEIEKAVTVAGGELEMLIEIVNSLKIDDATETTRIIDAITAVYSTLNQVKAALKKRLQSLVASEGAAQFAAQMKLLSQAASSYLDLCDSPAKCEEYLNRLSVQLEELEGTFADFEEYTVQLAERRTELYEAFEQRKVALVEQRNRKAAALMTAAERILKVIQNRLAGFKSIEDINSYMASDLMIAKVRETIDQLLALGDSVKADDLQGRLKSVQQEAVRQLKDRQELFVGGENVIKLGKHQFNVNTQPLDLTIVNRDGVQHVHLTSTKYFEAITDEAFLATRDVWDQEVVSENRDVYRGEYLAWQMLNSLESRLQAASQPAKAGTPNLAAALAFSDDQRLAFVQEFMGARYQEGYTKGIHDLDGAKIFHALLTTHHALQLARFSPMARACAVVYWNRFCPADTKTLWSAKLHGFAERNKLFPGDPTQQNYIAALQDLVRAFLEQTKLYPAEIAIEAGEYLFNELITGEAVSVSQEADQLVASFNRHLASKGSEKMFEQRRQALTDHPGSELDLVRDWVRGFLISVKSEIRNPKSEIDQSRLTSAATDGEFRYLEEISAILFCGDALKRSVVKAATSREIEGMRGSHALIEGSKYQFDYLNFQERLQKFERDVVPRFEKFHALKQELIERERGKLRLNEFKPKVLTSFVRNQLIDQVYLPLVGDNLAKQIGAAGAAKRTDLMGLLLVISPPGYGKTTLMEYVASRLGIVFIKINGPALGHNVVSLDPEEAPNAAAREEIIKLNLALEMGDNALICVDDIQHCSPEFLQKFISLCDGQRRIEGVWRGKPRTYDLRGRKVVVVMAGNPYTESGQKFKIPDMLANRADTYNLGDIIGGSGDYFKASYLENAVTSNAVLAPLTNKSQKDIRSFIRMAESGEREAEGFEGSYSSQEVEEILSVMKKLVMIREVILRVNQEYIYSAAQADEFRVEPPFRLQGSYRNMNRLAEKVVTIMNDDEVRGLIVDHYRGESQTLTTGAEANLLKFKELIGALTPEEKVRWEDIKQTFKRNNAARAAGGENDPAGRIVAQLSGFQSGLEGIQKVIADQLAKPPPPPAPAPQVVVDMSPVGKGLEALKASLEKQAAKPPPVQPLPSVTIDFEPLTAHLEALRNTVDQRLAQPATKDDNGHGDFNALAAKLGEGLSALRQDLSRAISVVHTGTMADAMKRMEHEMEMVHSTLATLKDMAARQRDHLHKSQELLETRAKQGAVEVEVTQEMLGNEAAFLEHFHKVIAEAQKQRETTEGGDQAPEKK